MRLIVCPSPEAASQWAANYVNYRIRQFQPTADRPFVLGLPTGSTPIGLYQRWVEFYQQGMLSFRHVVTFNLDEYVGLPQHHPESYHSFMDRHLFHHIDMPRSQIHIPDGNAADLEQECADYEQRIRAVGGLELVVGGVGEEGHVAFNEPGSSLASRTRLKRLAESTRAANARFFNHDITQVPTFALTMGVATLLEAREVMILALGRRKAIALYHAIEQGVNHLWPISAMQLHPNSRIVCDEEATLELKVKTVRYFKELEQDNPTFPMKGPTGGPSGGPIEGRF